MTKEIQIILLYGKGYTMEQISDELLVSLSKIQYVLKNNNIVTNNKKYRINHQTEELVKKCVRKGLRQKEISWLLDISIYTVKDIVKRNQMQHMGKIIRASEKKKGPFKSEESEKVYDRYLAGNSFNEIVALYKCSEETMIDILSGYLAQETYNAHRSMLKKRIIDLKKSKYTLVEIGKQLGISVCSLKLIIDER